MWVVAWVGFAVVVGVIANSRGRDWLRWFGLACLISPLLAGLLVLVLPSQVPGQEPISVVDGTAKKCPMCAELVRREAIKCKHCGSELQVETVSADEEAARKYGG